MTRKIVGSWSPTYGPAPAYEYHKDYIRGSQKKNTNKILQKLEIVFTASNVVGILYNCMGKLRIDRKALQAKLNIRRGSGVGRAIRKALLTKTPMKVSDRGLKVKEMTSYHKMYALLTEGSRGIKRTLRKLRSQVKRNDPRAAQKTMDQSLAHMEFRKPGEKMQQSGEQRAKATNQGIRGANRAYEQGKARIIKQQGHDNPPSQKALDALDKERSREYSRTVGREPNVLDEFPGKVSVLSDYRKKNPTSDAAKAIEKNNKLIQKRKQFNKTKQKLKTFGVSRN